MEIVAAVAAVLLTALISFAVWLFGRKGTKAAELRAVAAEDRAIRAEGRQLQAEAKQAKAEAELADNRRRAEGPKLFATELMAGHDVVTEVYDGIGPMPADGTLMRLALANRGAAVDEVKVDWHHPRGLECVDGQTLRTDEGYSAFLFYEFKRGSVRTYMRLPIAFTSASGAKLTHVYEVEHGGCHIRRVDPA